MPKAAGAASITTSSSTPTARSWAAPKSATTYDPRNAPVVSRRRWRRTASIITDPDVFAALGLIGFTVAAPFYADGKLRGRRRDRHHARRPVAVPRRAQDQPRHAELHPRPSGPGDRRLRPLQDLHHRARARSSCATSARSTTSCRPSPSAPVRASGGGTLYPSPTTARSTVASLSTLPAEFGKHWQLFIITPRRRFHRRLPDQQQPAAARSGCSRSLLQIVDHLLPDRRDLGAARAARRQGRQDRGAGRRAAAARALADPRDRRAVAGHRHARRRR